MKTAPRLFPLACLCTLLALAAAPSIAQKPAAAPKLDPNADLKEELPRIAPTSPAEAMKTFRLRSGFRLEQVAAEPLVASPVALSFDERGRMYVACMRGYSENAAERLGEVRLLEDSDGDGRFDKSRVFVDKLAWPTAVICYGGGVYIGDAPDILFCQDTNGDGRADVRRKVFTGFGTSNVQGLLNSFHWGLDNKIHGSASSTGGRVRQVGPNEKEPPLELRGRDFAFDPHTHRLEAESGGAQHGMCFDPWGRKFVCSNSSHIELVMCEDRYLRRNPYLAAPTVRQMIAVDGGQAEVFRISPVEPWRLVRTRLRMAGLVPGPVEGGGRAAGYFTSATGITIYKGNAWPQEYVGQAFVGDVGSNIVHRKKLEPDGVGLRALRIDEKKEFLASEDIWFRPVQFANAPDGTLYVIDMYREVIEHPLSLPPIIKKHLDLTSGRDRGRIYRIVPDGFTDKQPALPRLDSATLAQLVATLEHRNAWHRETASRLLYERQSQAAVPLLQKLAAESESPLGRMHALYALDGLRALTADVLLARLKDEHARVREHAVRLSERLAGESPALQAALRDVTRDSDLNVRYQLAFSLGQVTAAEGNRALAEIAKRDGGDPWLRLAILSSLTTGRGEVFAHLAEDAEYRRTPAARTMLGALAQQIGLAKRKDEMANVLSAVASLPGEEKSLAAALVAELSQGLNKSGSELRMLLASADGSAGKILDELLAAARKTAVDDKQPPAARAEALRTLGLGRFSEERALFAKLLDHRQPQEVQLAALAALSRFSEPDVGPIVLKAWPGMSPAVRSAAIETLFARPERLTALLDAVEGNQFRPGDLEPARVEFLRTYRDAKVRDRAKRLLAEVKLRRRQEIVDAYLPALKLQGDPGRGKLAFQKTCAKCHRLDGVGFELAPSLAAMKNRGPETILVNVLDPNREVNPQFVNYILLTADGRTITGIISAETATSVTLRRGEDQSDTVLRVNVEALASTGLSIMPEGLEKEIDQQTMADLIAYVLSAK